VSVQLTALALFAYYPEMVSKYELEQVTGIDDIFNKVLKQTNNKKYLRKTDDTFGLSEEGFAFFMEKVKPLVDAASQDSQVPNGGEE